MPHEETARQFALNGAAIVRRVFTPAQVDELRRELERFVDQIAPTLGGDGVYYEESPARPVKSAFHLEKHSDSFSRLMWDPKIVEVLNAIYPGDGLETTIGVAYFAKAARDGSVTPAHQDNGFQHWNPPLALTLTVAIDRSTPENGALTCNRGSHVLGLLPHQPSGVRGFSQCLSSPIDEGRFPPMLMCMDPGDVCMHHINAVHFSGANTSEHPRRQLGITYRSTRAQRDEASFARYMAQLEELLAKTRS